MEKQQTSSSIGRIMLLGVCLFIGVLLLLIFSDKILGYPVLLFVLAAFASIGVFFLITWFLGMIHFVDDKEKSDYSKEIVAKLTPGLIVTDLENRVLYANETYMGMFGATDISNTPSVESLLSKHDEAVKVVYRMINDAREAGSAVEEIRLKNSLYGKREQSQWLRLRIQLLKDEKNGQMLIWQMSDVTHDRFDQENAFQELQDAIHYLDHAPAGFVASDSDGGIVYMNATLADWLGVDLALFEPENNNIRDLIPADNEALFNTANSQSTQGKTSVVDLDFMCSDDHRMPVRIYHRIPDTIDGAPGTARTLVLNRSHELGDGNALRDAEIRFTRFFNNTPVAIAGVSHTGKIIRTNASFQNMFSAVVSKHGANNLELSKLVSSDDNTKLKELFEQATSGRGNLDPHELSIDDKQERFVRFFVSRVADEDLEGDEDKDNVERVIIYAVETTEQRALENQFAKGQKMQAVGQLAGGIAHDFNNVLTAIIGFSDLLLTNHKPSDPSFQDIMNIKQNANRAASLVRQLLAFSRRQTLRPQVLHMSDVLADLRMLMDRLVGDRITLELKHGRDLWPIKADVSQLEQVLVNLVVNARDAMDGEGHLEIRTRNISEMECRDNYVYAEMTPAEYVLIEVIDEGSGMSQEVMDKIFEPFFSTKEVGKGTGLGLSTVYGIVKQTGAFIFPISEEGKGTTFQVFLPRHIPDQKEISDAAEAANAVASDEPSKDLTGNASILLVEDEDAVRAFGARALISRGYDVHEAASGIEALEVMEEVGDEIDLVVSDVVMPEMDGPTLLGELRKTHPDLKFIFVSGYAEEAFAKNLPQSERDKFGFLPKPFSLKQLATTVKEMLDE